MNFKHVIITSINVLNIVPQMSKVFFSHTLRQHPFIVFFQYSNILILKDRIYDSVKGHFSS